MSLQAKVWTVTIVAVAVGAGTYLSVEKSHLFVQKKNLTNVAVTISNDCKVDPKEVTIHVGKEQVHWQAGSSGAKMQFSDSPFTDASLFVISGTATSVDSGLTTDDANNCAEASATSGKKCEYDYTVTVNGVQCTDPRVIVSK
jgi:hypothetical protein